MHRVKFQLIHWLVIVFFHLSMVIWFFIYFICQHLEAPMHHLRNMFIVQSKLFEWCCIGKFKWLYKWDCFQNLFQSHYKGCGVFSTINIMKFKIKIRKKVPIVQTNPSKSCNNLLINETPFKDNLWIIS